MKKAHNNLCLSDLRHSSSAVSDKPDRVVLGVDPGSRLLGYAILRPLSCTSSGSSGTGLVRTRSGTLNLISIARRSLEKKGRGASSLKIGNDRDIPVADRLAAIWTSLSEIIHDCSPTELAIEDIFSHKNVQSLKKLSQARGVVLALGGVSSLPIYEYSPASVKQSVVGHGRATKEQVREMLKSRIDLPERMGTDESDAIAIALCHIQAVTGVVSNPSRARFQQTNLQRSVSARPSISSQLVSTQPFGRRRRGVK